METIQTTALLRLAKIPRRVLETCCLSDSIQKPSANAGVKNSQKCIIIIIIIMMMNTRRMVAIRLALVLWRSRDELISDVLLWTPAYGQAKAGRPARTYIQQLCVDMGCSPEDLPEAMNDREKWRERVRDICASGMTR